MIKDTDNVNDLGLVTMIDSEGYAPHVPDSVDVDQADINTLILIIRDSLQNGHAPTRANLAMARLLSKLNLPEPELPLDDEPYMWDGAPSSAPRTANPKAHDSVYGFPVFAPRYGFNQNREAYRKKVI